MPRIIRPSGDAAPVIVHVPHASTVIPEAARAELLLSEAELADELLRLTDHHTDALFAGLGELGATLFVNDRSRFVFDPERFLEDSAEPMAARGQGVVYWQGTRGQPIRSASAELRERYVEEGYRPYHAALDALVAAVLEAFGVCLIVDGHSFPSEPLPSELDQAPDRPDICIGTDELHTPVALADALEAAFAAEGYVVRRDAPFAGTFVPGGFYGTDERVRSVMIEVRR
ncbi:MAG: N-formylglutamate amidohydrolase, partial [Candidatus Limnocylindrales bacterium]